MRASGARLPNGAAGTIAAIPVVSNPEPPDAHATRARRVVAVFDFDKTISTRDNVVPFLVAAAGRVAVLGALLRSAPDLGRGRRDAVKARLVRLLAGRDEHEVRAVADALARDVIDHHLRPDVVARVRWHQGQGHEIAIVSASFAWYLEPVARRLGVDAVLATGLEVAKGRLTGRLDGPNVRRAEKVRRLDAWLGHAPAVVWAYGDSTGDRELLARADVAVRVGRTPLTAAPDGADAVVVEPDQLGPDRASGTGPVAR